MEIKAFSDTFPCRASQREAGKQSRYDGFVVFAEADRFRYTTKPENSRASVRDARRFLGTPLTIYGNQTGLEYRLGSEEGPT